MRARVFAVVAVASIAVTIPALPARAASGPIAAVVVDGGGFGHGRGMSQYGARDLATHRTPWTGILAHYYPGTSIARAGNPAIRVLVADRPAIVAGGRDTVTVRFGRTSVPARWARVTRDRASAHVDIAWSAAGPWHGAGATNGSVTIAPRRSSVGLVSDGAVRAYRGTLVVTPSGSGLRAIDVVRLDDYLLGVVPREMPAAWPMAALQAQAVAARTYALDVLAAARAGGAAYDICSTAACQVYDGTAWSPGPALPFRASEDPRTTAAARSTAGRVVVSAGRPILAEYSSSNGGWTAAGGVPYLPAHDDPADRSSPYYRWSIRVSPARIAEHWCVGTLRGVRVIRRDGAGLWGGRALAVRITGSASTTTVSAAEFAGFLGLRSTLFALTSEPARYRFDGDLGFGTRSDAVRELQGALRRAGSFPRTVTATGYFGPITLAAVRRFQRAHHIHATGFVGPLTRAALND